MRICTKCKSELDESMFFIRNKEKGTLQSHCKECKRKIDLRGYHEDRHGRKQKIRSSVKIARIRNRQFVDDILKESSCAICGDKRWYVLDFHHLDKTTKSINVAEMKNMHFSTETIKKEIDKCQIICSNCHRELHYKERCVSK